MRNISLFALAFWLAACATQGQKTQLPQHDGEVLPYGYSCKQGRISVEYARMSGQDSATLSFSDGKEQTLRKVLPRVGEHAFALDELRWEGQDEGRIYTLRDGGQILLENCQGAARNVFNGKEDHQGTVKLDLGRILR